MKFHITKKRGSRSLWLDSKYGHLRISVTNTVWHHQSFTPRYRHPLRHDTVIGFDRILIRELHEYIFNVYVGPLMISWWHHRKDLR